MANKIVEIVRPSIEEIVKANNLNLYDLDFLREDGTWFLRVSIEKSDGTMDFETAEVISDLVSAKLDELDPIDHEYVLDVCSPGVEKPIRNKDEYLSNLNNYITVNLKHSDSLKNDSYTGDLVEVTDEFVTISYKEKTKVKKVSINFENIENAHIAVKF